MSTAALPPDFPPLPDNFVKEITSKGFRFAWLSGHKRMIYDLNGGGDAELHKALNRMQRLKKKHDKLLSENELEFFVNLGR